VDKSDGQTGFWKMLGWHKLSQVLTSWKSIWSSKPIWIILDQVETS